MGFFGKLICAFFGAVAALGGIGLWQRKRSGDKDDAFLTQKAVDNVLAIRDRFNRARYMDRDGK